MAKITVHLHSGGKTNIIEIPSDSKVPRTLKTRMLIYAFEQCVHGNEEETDRVLKELRG